MFPLADKALGGSLVGLLRDRRGEGESYEDIARELHGLGVAVSGETVRKWCAEHAITKPVPERAS